MDSLYNLSNSDATVNWEAKQVYERATFACKKKQKQRSKKKGAVKKKLRTKLNMNKFKQFPSHQVPQIGKEYYELETSVIPKYYWTTPTALQVFIHILVKLIFINRSQRRFWRGREKVFRSRWWYSGKDVVCKCA